MDSTKYIDRFSDSMVYCSTKKAVLKKNQNIYLIVFLTTKFSLLQK